MLISIKRFWAIVLKEFILMKRDPAVLFIMAILPVILVTLAGYVIETYPKHVPTVLVSFDNSDITRDILARVKNTEYFSIIKTTNDAKEAEQYLKTGKAFFVITIPNQFTQDLVRNLRPVIILEDGGIDALTTGRAVGVISGLKQYYSEHIEAGPLYYLKTQMPAFQLIYHRLYNPNHITQYYSIPGVITLVLMLTMLMITSVIAFRDIQGGTIHYLLLSPTRPTEILLAEIVSYIFIGYVQLIIGVCVSYYWFDIPFVGSIWLLLLCALPYIIAELSLGLAIASFCKSQFQAVQLINLFIALSIILTGFIFPRFTMPEVAQWMGVFLPMTHFLNIIYGIVLKGNQFNELWPSIWPLLLISSVMITFSVRRFKRQFNGFS